MRREVNLVTRLLLQPRLAAVGHGLVERLEVFERGLVAFLRGRAEVFVEPPVGRAPGVGLLRRAVAGRSIRAAADAHRADDEARRNRVAVHREQFRGFQALEAQVPVCASLQADERFGSRRWLALASSAARQSASAGRSKRPSRRRTASVASAPSSLAVAPEPLLVGVHDAEGVAAVRSSASAFSNFTRSRWRMSPREGASAEKPPSRFKRERVAFHVFDQFLEFADLLTVLVAVVERHVRGRCLHAEGFEQMHAGFAGQAQQLLLRHGGLPERLQVRERIPGGDDAQAVAGGGQAFEQRGDALVLELARRGRGGRVLQRLEAVEDEEAAPLAHERARRWPFSNAPGGAGGELLVRRRRRR